MAHQFASIAFTDSVREVQEELGSRESYAGMDGGEDRNSVLSGREVEFIQERDSFYMASVSETGWPYVQHRGGSKGFLKVLDPQTLGFADFSGNRQYISTGNFLTNDRVSLILMDYPNRTRLKILGRVRHITDDLALLASLENTDYRARVERAFIIHIQAFDWNCPQHITPRYTDQDIERLIAPLRAENDALKRQIPKTPPVIPRHWVMVVSTRLRSCVRTREQRRRRFIDTFNWVKNSTVPGRSDCGRFSVQPADNNRPFTASLANSGQQVNVAKDETLLDALLSAGIAIPYSCKSGNCKSCVVNLIEGEVMHRDTCLSSEERDKGLMCPCVSRAKTASLTLDI